MRPFPAKKIPWILPLQLRGARAMLDWTQADLAGRSGISKRTIATIELGDGEPRPETVEKLVRAMEAGGIEFYWTKEGYPGIALHGRGNAEAPAP